MTVITITTIGFGEVRALSTLGRIFTMGLILVGVLTASYAITTMIELFASEEFQKQLGQRRRRKTLEKIDNHCIICGFGRMGRSLANDLLARGAAMVVIDQDADMVERCHQLGIPAILGNAADERVLQEAGIERAGSLVAAANSDAENVFIVLTASGLKPGLPIIARCNSEASIPKLEKAGASSVISPYAIAGRRIGQMLTRPRITSFLDGILEFGGEQMRLEEFIIDESSPLVGLTLREARLKVAVLAIAQPDQELLSHPKADTRLLPGAAIIVMGTEQNLKQLAQMVKV
jgi:voltage-gated potassium channel